MILKQLNKKRLKKFGTEKEGVVHILHCETIELLHQSKKEDHKITSSVFNLYFVLL